MLSTTTKTELASLRKGVLDTSAELSFKHLSGKSLIDELLLTHPFIFQRRDFGRKHEIGMARRVAYELVFQNLPKSLFQGVRLRPTLSQCYLISTYEDAICEITWTARVHVRPVPDKGKGLALSFGSGYKLDKTIDGWTVKPLLRRRTNLSEELLTERGWQFAVLPPFGIKSAAS